MGYVVVDKSYLQKVVNTASLDILAATNKIVITDILLYEITSSEDNRPHLRPKRQRSTSPKRSPLRFRASFLLPQKRGYFNLK
jgi:hypothetical protein